MAPMPFGEKIFHLVAFIWFNYKLVLWHCMLRDSIALAVLLAHGIRDNSVWECGNHRWKVDGYHNSCTWCWCRSA